MLWLGLRGGGVVCVGVWLSVEAQGCSCANVLQNITKGGNTDTNTRRQRSQRARKRTLGDAWKGAFTQSGFVVIRSEGFKCPSQMPLPPNHFAGASVALPAVSLSYSARGLSDCYSAPYFQAVFLVIRYEGFKCLPCRFLCSGQFTTESVVSWSYSVKGLSAC